MKKPYMVFALGMCRNGQIKNLSFIIAQSSSEAMEQGVHNLINTPNIDLISIGETFAIEMSKELVIVAAEELQKQD